MKQCVGMKAEKKLRKILHQYWAIGTQMKLFCSHKKVERIRKRTRSRAKKTGTDEVYIIEKDFKMVV